MLAAQNQATASIQRVWRMWSDALLRIHTPEGIDAAKWLAMVANMHGQRLRLALDLFAGCLLGRSISLSLPSMRSELEPAHPVSPSVPKDTPGDECHGDHAENDKGYSKCAAVHRSRTYTMNVSRR